MRRRVVVQRRWRLAFAVGARLAAPDDLGRWVRGGIEHRAGVKRRVLRRRVEVEDDVPVVADAGYGFSGTLIVPLMMSCRYSSSAAMMSGVISLLLDLE